MADDEAGHGGVTVPASAGTLCLRVVVRTPSVETFIEKYSRFVKDDRIFIFTKTSQASGTSLRFALELGDGKPLVTGEGTVTRVRPETGDASRPPGMELRFVATDDQSRKIVALMLAERDTRSAAPRPATVEPRAELPMLPLTGAHTAFPPSNLLLALTPQGPEVPPPLTGEQVPGSTVRAASTAPEVGARFDASPHDDTGLAFRAALPTSCHRPPLDADSLFAMQDAQSEPGPPPDAELPPLPEERTALTRLSDELSHSFPGVAPVFAETWRPLFTDASEVPANPFSELPDDAIEYFVEWSLDRSQGPQPLSTPPFAAPAIVAWKAQQVHPALSHEPARQAGRRGFAVGICVGLVVGGAVAALALGTRAIAPVAQVVEPPRMATAVAPAPAAAPVAAPVAVARRADVAITSHPPGATCVVDGAPAGRTPLTLSLDPGTHAVVLTMDRYTPLETTVGAPGSLDATLKRPLAMLKLSSSPTGGTVKIDGQGRGNTPLSIPLSAYEHHDVAVAGAGGRSWHRKVYVRAPSMTVAATLSSAPSSRSPGIR